MPAPLAKGIIISLSILAAIGIAVYENPQVKEWVEDQRRKIAEFLNSFGDELDPQSRREAEAFVNEGRLPTPGREADGSASAVARATGRDTTEDAISRRNRSSVGSSNTEDAAERRRLGREYLAKRNQDMLEMREKQKMRKSILDEDTTLSEKAPPSPTFDNLVNEDGTLKSGEKAFNEKDDDMSEKPLELPSVPTEEPKSLSRKIPIEEPAETTAFQAGSRYANPFGDEYEMSASYESRSATPKPPIPPKIALEDTRNVRKLSIPSKEPSVRQIPILYQDDEDQAPANLDFDEQLARALSLSLAESEAAARLARQKQIEEQDAADYMAAVEASLAETKLCQQEAQEEKQQPQNNDLINLTPDPPVSIPHQHTSSSTDTYDELYTLSPDFAQHRPLPIPIPGPMIIPPYDPVHEAAASSLLQPQTPPSTTDIPPQSPTTATLSPEYERDAISSFAPSESDADEFASVDSRARQQSPFPSSSEASLIDFAEVESVSDGDESEVGDGVLTPGSWTDVGSEVDSEEGVRVA